MITIKKQKQQNTIVVCLKKEQIDHINLDIQILLNQLRPKDLELKGTFLHL